MRRLALTLAALLLAAFAVTGESAAASAAPADTLYTLVNQQRAANGLPALARNASIEAVAVNWANHMAASGTLSHNPAFSSQVPGGWTAVAENVAQGQPTAERMHADWMASAGHRANILGDFTSVGIAFIKVNGTTWGVQNFAKYAEQAASPPPPAPPATASAAPDAPPSAPKAAAPAPTATSKPAPASTPQSTPTSAPTSTPPPSEALQPPSGAQPTAESPADPVPSNNPTPDATESPARALADQVGGNPVGAVTLLGLALTAAVTFIIKSARRGRWARHRSWQ